MSTVAVNKTVLLWALERSGHTVDDLLPTFPKLREWIAGQKQPTLHQLEEYAASTHTPLGFLFLKTPPQERLPIPYYRTADGKRPVQASAELLDTVHAMQLRQAWMRDEAVDQGQSPLSFVATATAEDPAAEVAEHMRRLLGFRDDWATGERTWTEALRRLREAVEGTRILVVVNGVVGNNTHRKLDPQEFRGFVLVDEYAPLVFVNNADAKAAQMFTLAHELAHVFFGSSAAFDLRQLMPAQESTEQACDRVAAEFLVPERLLRHVWPTASAEPEPFHAIARRFKVSQIVAARRALDLQLIGRERFMAFYQAYAATQRKSGESPSGGDFYVNQSLRVGARFGRAIVRAVKEGRLDYTGAYRLTGLYGRTFEQFAASLGAKGV